MKDPKIKNVLVIGSGPIQIGQAAEFDYSGTQACRTFKEEGLRVIVLNSNPATIQTELEFADVVYIEPINSFTVEKIILNEKIDSIAPGFGGQTALNLVFELHKNGILDKYGVKIIGTGIDSIEIAEDREKFRDFLLSLGEPVPIGIRCRSIEEVKEAARKIGRFPIIIRSSFTLGGTGSGIVRDMDSLFKIAEESINLSPIHEIIVEESLLNLQEFELELIRDNKGNKIVVCSMENVDPMGIHTGESIVVTPSLTLSDEDYQTLRDSAFKIIEGLKIVGSCNIQFSLDPESGRYYVIEVNPRTSRSSALASKATGFPIARIAAKLALGYTLDEIINPVTGVTYSSFEPSIDYITVKIPRWPFDRFRDAERKIGMSMKSTGEVMGIGRSFEEAFMKALLSLDQNYYSLERLTLNNEELLKNIEEATDVRIFCIAEALRRNISPEEISRISGWNLFFIKKIQNIVKMEDSCNSIDCIKNAKRMGLSDRYIAKCLNMDEIELRRKRIEMGILPVFKAIDTCAGEFEASTPYYYSTYLGEENESNIIGNSIIIVGSGPIRIGQGIEFDYSSVEAVLGIKGEGKNAIIINNNPETVSTDFDISNKLYFEPITFEHVANIIELEKPLGVMVQFGGQTSINIVKEITEYFGRSIIIGTSYETIDILEDRGKFSAYLETYGLEKAPSFYLQMEEAKKYAERLGYPILIRPSYIIGGEGVAILYSEEDLNNYIKSTKIKRDTMVLIEKYIENAIEIDIDAISNGKEVWIMGMLEHIEEAGIHSGDSTMLFPPVSIDNKKMREIEDIIKRITLDLGIVGLVNYQIMLKGGKIIFIEGNPRASRTVPFLSKARGEQYPKKAALFMIGANAGIKEINRGLFYSKLSVFPFSKIKGSDVILGPEMKSTGEIMGIGRDPYEALHKSFISAYGNRKKSILLSLNDDDKRSLDEISEEISSGFEIYATEGTARYLRNLGVDAIVAYRLKERKMPTIYSLIDKGMIGYIVNTPSKSYTSQRDGYMIRRYAVDHGVPVITNMRLAKFLIRSLSLYNNNYNLYPFSR
ncbi:MAG: carbamoyl-phosphate synthase (glutamine-hydrolyzing) large subunit [Euryarchaeota archaeon]|nr:carbamoyl-phosphate synthase (glutamine-hydrolyzing) large subunit [Euryarchaeota archaeon]